MRTLSVTAAVAILAAALLAPVSAAASSGGDWFGPFVGALLGEIIGHRVALRSDVRMQQQLDSQRRTTEDETALRGIATALDEYAVDHNGAYPASLDALRPLYYNRPAWIPETAHPAQYRYEVPAARAEWGKWDVVDNGAFDPTLHDLRALDGSLCTHASCRYIVYAEGVGLVGAPEGYESK